MPTTIYLIRVTGTYVSQYHFSNAMSSGETFSYLASGYYTTKEEAQSYIERTLAPVLEQGEEKVSELSRITRTYDVVAFAEVPF